MESRRLLILYGSETGCAQDTAERIGRQARRRHFKARVMAMDEYDRVRAEPCIRDLRRILSSGIINHSTKTLNRRS